MLLDFFEKIISSLKKDSKDFCFLIFVCIAIFVCLFAVVEINKHL